MIRFISFFFSICFIEEYYMAKCEINRGFYFYLMAQIQQSIEDQPKNLLVTQIILKQPQIQSTAMQIKNHSPLLQKKLIVSDLNLNNPEDRALSLCLKMLQMRKKRQSKQVKLIQEIRKSRIVENKSMGVGDTSRIIDKQHLILRHQYLRQQLYRVAKPKITTKTQKIRPIISNQQRKAVFQRELAILEKSKRLTERHIIKKMILDIFEGVIDKIVKTVQSKKRFFFGSLPGKISDDLQRNWSRVAPFKNASEKLKVSRVLDLKMEGKSSQQSQDSDSHEQQAQQNEQSHSQQTENDASQEQSSNCSDQNEDSLQDKEQKQSQPQQSPSQLQQAQRNSEQSNEDQP